MDERGRAAALARRQPRQDRNGLIAGGPTLVFGSTGLLGQAVMAEARRRGIEAVGAARSDADIDVDIADLDSLRNRVDSIDPSLVVNCAAIVDLGLCERDPALAYSVNARPLAVLGQWSRETGRRLVQVSTDHYFAGEGPVAHGEDAPITLYNEYARSKFAGEAFALTSPDALVLRTSIVGLRGRGAMTFGEWALDVVEAGRPATLFSDAFTSSMDTGRFAAAMFELAEGGTTGILNLAAAEVYSKEAFIREIARQSGRELDAKVGTVNQSQLRRGTALGLDVSRASALLSTPLPSMRDVVAALLEEASQRTLS